MFPPHKMSLCFFVGIVLCKLTGSFFCHHFHELPNRWAGIVAAYIVQWIVYELNAKYYVKDELCDSDYHTVLSFDLWDVLLLYWYLYSYTDLHDMMILVHLLCEYHATNADSVLNQTANVLAYLLSSWWIRSLWFITSDFTISMTQHPFIYSIEMNDYPNLVSHYLSSIC